jgi:hypothetical protein
MIYEINAERASVENKNKFDPTSGATVRVQYVTSLAKQDGYAVTTFSRGKI